MIKKLDKFAIKNLTLIIIIGQILVYLGLNSKIISYEMLYLSYPHIFSGQIWRVISFIFIPPTSSPIWAVLAWYFFYLIGSSLEHFWGALHYNIYILIAVVLTNIVAFLFNFQIGSNYYIQTSLFLAFAFLNPEYQIRLFFIIPIKIKWIAILTWILYLGVVLFGSTGEKLLLASSIINFILYFNRDIYFKLKYRGKKVKIKIEKKVTENRAIHTCAKCGINDKDNPYTDFRYCSQCTPEQCYCQEHILDHDHYQGE
ncbi:MAG: hypothetical protein OCD02_20050 [Spirochaetaceae bacterium]